MVNIYESFNFQKQLNFIIIKGFTAFGQFRIYLRSVGKNGRFSDGDVDESTLLFDLLQGKLNLNRK